MYKKNVLNLILASVIISCLLINQTSARDLAGIEWKEFKNKSEFIFSGYLIKAEIIDEGKMEISYTYRITKVFKGEKLEKVSFKASLYDSASINNTVVGVAIVALRKINGEWKLSIDERSCWIHENEMKEDFHGFPVYRIPTTLLYNFPKELGEKVKLKRLYGDDYRIEEIFVYPKDKVDNYLEKYLD